MKLLLALVFSACLCSASTLSTPDPLKYCQHGKPITDPGFVLDHTHGHEHGVVVEIDPPIKHLHSSASVPEPGAFVLIGSALIILGVLRRK